MFRLTLVMIVLGAIGCSVHTESMTFASRPPATKDHPIAIYVTKKPESPYEELGYVKSKPTSLNADWETIKAIKKRARRHGGDAVILNIEPSGSGKSRVIEGTIIRFTEPGCWK